MERETPFLQGRIVVRAGETSKQESEAVDNSES